jgi:hypothetical protein
MIGIASRGMQLSRSPHMEDLIDNLPGHPARRVQFRVSAGLLTDGSSSLSAFPGIKPSDMFENGLAAYSCGGSFVSQLSEGIGEIPNNY